MIIRHDACTFTLDAAQPGLLQALPVGSSWKLETSFEWKRSIRRLASALIAKENEDLRATMRNVLGELHMRRCATRLHR